MRVMKMLVPAAAMLLALNVEARATTVDAPVAVQAASVAPVTFAFSAAQVQDTQTVAKSGDVQVTRTTWYVNPVWIIVGVAALAIVIALIVAGSRGGGTTIIR